MRKKAFHKSLDIALFHKILALDKALSFCKKTWKNLPIKNPVSLSCELERL
jgi:hypothetical protein